MEKRNGGKAGSGEGLVIEWYSESVHVKPDGVVPSETISAISRVCGSCLRRPRTAEPQSEADMELAGPLFISTAKEDIERTGNVCSFITAVIGRDSGQTAEAIACSEQGKPLLDDLFESLDSPSSQERKSVADLLAKLSQTGIPRIREALLKGVEQALAEVTSGVRQDHRGVAELVSLTAELLHGEATAGKKRRVALFRLLVGIHSRPAPFRQASKQLALLVANLCSEDASRLPLLVRRLLSLFRHAEAAVVAQFFSEIHFAIESTRRGEETATCARSMIPRIASAVNSPHFLVAFRSLSLLGSACVQEAVRATAAESLALLVPPVIAASRHHWETTVRLQALGTLSILRRIDHRRFDAIILEQEKH